MKVQIVRLVIASCTTFLAVYCLVYAMGKSKANRSVVPAENFTERSFVEAETSDKDMPAIESDSRDSVQTETASKVFHIEESWFQGSKEARGRFARLLREQHAPELTVNQWTNADAMDLSDQEGKIVVISFWSTWCQPCLKSIDFNNKLYQHYQDQNVTFIGVCANEGSQDMAKIVKSKDIQYPVCSDLPSNKSILAYQVQAIPSYFVIDRSGRLRFADVKRGRVDDAIEYLLSRD